MTNFPWFPIGHEIACGTVGRLRAEGAGYQVLHDQSSERLMLVIASDSSAGKGAAASSVATRFEGVDFGGRSFLAISMSKAEEPVPVLQWPKRFGLPTSPDIKAMSKAISDLRQRDSHAEVGSALFVPPIEVCLPVKGSDRPEDMKRLAANVLVASGQISSLDIGSIRGLNPWVSAQDIKFFLEALGISEVLEPPAPEDFSLPGRPALEAFFREYVIEPSADPARYDALRVQLPNGILLYGPPGSGKTHAVDTLVAALRRPVFRLELGEVGSPFIHQTTVSMRKAFEQAKRSAPSLLILEEIDAVAPARGPMSHDHKVEELTEILRMIEFCREEWHLSPGDDQSERGSGSGPLAQRALRSFGACRLPDEGGGRTRAPGYVERSAARSLGPLQGEPIPRRTSYERRRLGRKRSGPTDGSLEGR